MRFLLLLVFLTRAELVIVNGNEIENRLILTNGRNPCEGVVKIYHGNQWGFVGDKFWNSSTEAVVCRSIRCGEPVRGPTETTDIPEGGLIWLNELKCGGNESQLWGCEHPGWNISVYLKNTVRKVKCSNTVQIKLDGSKCAGAVRYSNNGTSPSGYICDENWGEKEASFLCEKLGCGKSKEIPKQQWMVWKEFEKSEKMRIKCLGISENEEDLWQCVFKESSTCQNPASVICQEHERLQLTNDPSNACSGRLETEKGGKWQNADNLKNTSDQWCQQMHCGTKVSHSEDSGGIQLKCSEQVKVVLMDNNKRSDCYGEVHIEVNNHVFCVRLHLGQEGGGPGLQGAELRQFDRC
ncbi:hypothetical protein Q5P01_007297 [Channa striata]|uniref:SRCR domain-containing protein n=1 Tax=Channa striata TaxID=64152 RepID=A0AA88SW88_CHASR|nr:hypothetical protein Q5P01_007297 [Channa striata]